MNERFCAQCGALLNENAVFCGSCGAPVPAICQQSPVEEVPCQQPPVEEVPQQIPVAAHPNWGVDPAPAKPAKNPLKIRRNFGIAFVSFILTLALFASLLSGLFILGLRFSISEQGCKTLVKDIITDDDLLEMSADELMGEGGNATVSEWIIESIEKETNGQMDIDEDALEEYLEESGLVDLLCGKIGSSVSKTFTGTGDTTLGTKELRQALKKDRRLIEKLFGVELPEESIDAVVEEIEKSGAIEELEVNLIGSVENEITDVTQKVFGAETITTAFLISAGLILLVCLLNRFNMVFIGRDIGSTFAWVGAFLCIPSAVFEVFKSNLEQGEAFMKIITALVEGVLSKLLITGIICIGIGIVLAVIGTVLKIQIKRKAL